MDRIDQGISFVGALRPMAYQRPGQGIFSGEHLAEHQRVFVGTSTGWANSSWFVRSAVNTREVFSVLYKNFGFENSG